MKKLYLLVLGIAIGFNSFSQNPATTFTIANHTILLPCGTNCTSITAQVPHIKGTNDYVITRPAYVPFAYTTAGGTEMTGIYTDDMFSAAIPLPFIFCFYGSFYASVVMGSNDIITFDVTNANTGNAWPLTVGGNPQPAPYSGGTQGSAGTTYYPRASIMGPYHDIYPTTNGSGQRKIEWRIEGTAPNRRFIASYNSVPMFSCTTTYATAQTVIYEGTGIVEVYVHDKPLCTGWNSGLAILGIQNFNQDQAVTAFGKNCTAWGGATSIDSCYRFVPTFGTSRFVNAQLLVNGTTVYTTTAADTSTASPGILNINFPNVCPAADSTQYVLKVRYTACGSESFNDFFDTVYVKKQIPPTLVVGKTDATCSANGSITVTATGTGPFEYSINGGTTWQASNVFPNVTPGTYQVTARKIGSTCAAPNQSVTVTLINTLAMTVNKVDANCTGGSITINATGGATPYQYSINGGTTYQASNTFTGLSAATYNVVVRDNAGCTQSQSVTLTFTNNLTVSASQVVSICVGGSYTSNFTGNATTYSWSPTTGVSNPAILNPVFSPSAPTTYTLTATLGSCTTTRTLALTVFPGASANAGPDAVVILGDPYQMLATGSAGTYLWTPSSGLSATNILNPVATPTQTTTYTLRVTTPQGCFATDDMTLTVIPYCVKPMEAFTPNGDGINDLWLITNGNCLIRAKASVFNRYGAEVFEASDYKNNWDGTYKGKPLPDGTYYFVIDYQLLNGKEVLLKGNVTILR